VKKRREERKAREGLTSSMPSPKEETSEVTTAEIKTESTD
jgi:hypothetical protein